MKFLDRFRKDKSARDENVAAPAALPPAAESPPAKEPSIAPAIPAAAPRTPESSAPVIVDNVVPTTNVPTTAAEVAAVETARAGFFARFRSDKADEDGAPSNTVEQPKKANLFSRLKAGLRRTGSSFSEGIGNLFLGRKEIDDELLEELETRLLLADVGIDATQHIIGNLTRRVSRKELADAQALYGALQEELKTLLLPSIAPLQIDAAKKPFVILMVGVNGVGKTTTIGKLAKKYQAEGRSVLLAAGDTFRAAAVEQLQVWGDRNNVPVIAQHTGADSASVLFDALQAAQARGSDILIADTAGRLHNKDHLMEELKKVVRVLRKLDPTAPHEVMLVLDAGTGQNALSQAKHFQEAVGVSGITLTKLDGTAKGGIIFAISRQCALPIRFIGVGEQADDLRTFEADEFIRALFEREDDAAA
jgi:fused signal recognition particle receptor